MRAGTSGARLKAVDKKCGDGRTVSMECKEQRIRVGVEDFQRMILASGEQKVAENVERGDGLCVTLMLRLENAPQFLFRRRLLRILLIRRIQRISLHISLILLLIKITYATG